MYPIALLLAIAPLVAIGGLAILWIHQWSRFRDRSRPSPWDSNAVATVGWTLMLLGIFALVGFLANVLFIVAWVVLIVILVTLVQRYRAIQRRSLLWMLTVAAERGIPLEAAARAFAEEQQRRLASQALDLAEYLEAGLPLAIALKRSGIPYPPGVFLTAELGQQTGQLGSALREALGQSDESESILQSAAERLYYLVVLLTFGLALLTFIMLKIVPALEKILHDFGTPRPAMMTLVVSIAWALANYWYLVVLVLAVPGIALLRILSYYTGSSPRYLPGVNPFWSRVDRGMVMRWLAVAVRQNRPMSEMMRLLAGYVPRHRLRHKLQRAAKRIDQGENWSDSLRRYGLIRRFEAAVLASAERTGNLAWALHEMAQSSVRRATWRLRAAINIAFPAAIILVGAVVLSIVLAILTPLLTLIRAIS